MTDIRSFLEWTRIGQKAMTAGRKDQRETRKECRPIFMVCSGQKIANLTEYTVYVNTELGKAIIVHSSISIHTDSDIYLYL